MYEFEVGDIVYDASYRCLVEILEISGTAQFKVKSIKSDNTYFVYGVFINTLEATRKMLENQIKEHTDCIKQIDTFIKEIENV